jgi:DNA-binding MarR family transcriptional regulator
MPTFQEFSLSRLKEEIAQTRPFTTVAEEAMLNLIRTADCLNRAVQREIRHWGITSTQYNVLRILRGAQPDGLPCAAIGDRMITAEPDITRLLARLKAQKLVRQQRGKADRRVVFTQITSAGLDLLARMDEPVEGMTADLFGHMTEENLRHLISLLEDARARCGDRQAAPTCDGKSDAGICSTPIADSSISRAEAD